MNKAEIMLIITAVKSIISLVEAFKPDLIENEVVKELNNAIAALESLGL